jgi:hypothetical protein
VEGVGLRVAQDVAGQDGLEPLAGVILVGILDGERLTNPI